MTGIWVDTDFGFDDLWALLLLRHLGCAVAGVSLVAGNAALPQVAANAVAARHAYGFDWPLWQGAARPLKRAPETAARILGDTGMRTRGRALTPPNEARPPFDAVAAMRNWLVAEHDAPPQILALGPLTNIARLLMAGPELARRVGRLVWMGATAGAGNHTARAEFNALADAEALELVAASGLPFDIVDLTFCRKVTFGPGDMPETTPLTHDLLGGYLDIALERGRPGMAIYDPVAALAIACPDAVAFAPCKVTVDTTPGASYGATDLTPVAVSATRISVGPVTGLSHPCLKALEREPADGPRL